MEKIFIIGNTSLDKVNIANKIIDIDNSLNLAHIFSSDKEYENQSNDESYIYYRDNEDICLDYKNNALLFVNSINEYTNYGITIDELYNKDIFCLNYSDFFNISNYILKDEDILVVWVDSYINDDIDHSEVKYTDNFIDELDKFDIPHLYFNASDSIDDIASIVIDYINGDSFIKQDLREDFF